MRFSVYEPAIYELTVTAGQGIQIVGPAPLGEGLLTGVPRLVGEPPVQRCQGGVRTKCGNDPDRRRRGAGARLPRPTLADVGHRTLQAMHGAQSLELVEKEPPGLLISDIMMPVRSAAGRRSADGTGADAFISKPFDLEDMQTLGHRWSPSQDLGLAPLRSS
jgi:hypothetical protein